MMLFWYLFALMTGAAIFSVLWPLGRTRHAGMSARAADMAVYRDQLTEIRNDRARGLIADSEAEAARIEVARRLLSVSGEAAAEPAKSGALGRRRAAAIMALAGIPVVALSLYFLLGSPGQPGAPLTARMEKPVQSRNVAMLLARVEAHLAEKPDDGRGWELLAPLYLSMGRTADAVKARTNAIRTLGSTAEREGALGEALVADAKGMVTADARAAFDRAISMDPHQAKSRFFLGLAAEQDGRSGEAERIWQALAADAPAGASWLPAVRAGLARLKDDTKAAPK
jgi:cytochrome c-type biogenesis protein CcmH